MRAEDDDARLVAFIDGRLDESASAAFKLRLAADEELRARLAQLQAGGRPFAPAFEALLDEAPVARLRASLDALGRNGRNDSALRAPRGLRVGALGIAAGIVLFCAGLIGGRYGEAWFMPPSEIAEPASGQHEDWRQAVAEYMDLYTADTFSGETDSQQGALATVGAKVGLDLTPARIELSDLQFKGAQIFSYDGAPLGQLGYIDPATGPVLFCIIRDSEADAAMTTEKRQGFAVASWARAGRGYMLIGRLADDQIAALAASLEQRF